LGLGKAFFEDDDEDEYENDQQRALLAPTF
jgi:hypothetical protein